MKEILEIKKNLPAGQAGDKQGLKWIDISSPSPLDIHFLRTINFIGEDKIKVMDIITNQTRKGIKKVKIGDEFFVRYVPQSLYFQKEELNIKGYYLDASELKKLSRFGRITLERIIYTSSGAVIFN